MAHINQALTKHIGWSVCTAGWIELDLEDVSPYNRGRLRNLPPGYRMILKHIDPEGYAYTYRDDQGVMKFPSILLEPYQR